MLRCVTKLSLSARLIIIPVFLSGLFLSTTLSSQYVIEALPRWMVSGHVCYLIPGDPIKPFLDGDDWGFHLEALYRVQYNKPFQVGLYYSEAGISKYVLEYTVPSPEGDQLIKEKANTRRLEFGLTAGCYPEINWLLQPYLQGRLGAVVYQSSSILTDKDSGESIDRINEGSDIVPAYGLDLGIHVVPKIWYIRGDIRIGFMANPSATFLTLGDNPGTAGYPIEYFEEHTAAGFWLKISAGMTYMF